MCKQSSTIIKLIILFTIAVSSNAIFAQFFDDFSDGDFITNPTWEGNVSDFIINDAGELQLNANEAGESYLYTNLTYPDTIQMDFLFRLEMSPSSSNFGLIYLGLDNIDPEIANGYYIQIGESGSEDAIRLFRLDEGNETLLATGSSGAVASDPAQAAVSITIYPDGLWSFRTDYEISGLSELEFEIMDNTHSFTTLNTFGLYCKYTETRKENFFYDNIKIDKFKEDKTGPTLVDLFVSSDQSLLLTFNEKLDVSNAEKPENYVVDNNFGSPLNSVADGARVFLTFDQPFESGIPYQLAIMNLTDENGNELIPLASPFVVTVPPSVGDLVINEVLSDPIPNGTDFVEIYNVSEKFINLNGLIIENVDKEESKTITENIELRPGQYLCFTEDKDFILENYITTDADQIIEIDLPSFNNDEGNVSLSHTDTPAAYIDQFDYTDDLHFELLDDTEGVSLERLSFNADSQSADNWNSAASTVGFATPGVANSNLINIGIVEGEFSLVSQTFSPNSDGDNDQLIINYSLEKSGYIANVKIFDDEGFEIDQIMSNASLATEGLITWDGTNAEGNKSEIGIYIILTELFHTDGDVKNFKNVCVLADFLR